MRSTAIIFGLLSLAAASAAQVAPAMPDSGATATVKVHDLDLGTTQGRTTLERRLFNAAADVCGEASQADRTGRTSVAECRTAVIERALSNLASREGQSRLAAR